VRPKKTPDGKFYIVNGEKKWITNGVFADFFTVACRTGDGGHFGVSLIVVERGPGVTTRLMECSGAWGSGTTYITFEDVRVPVENLIGQEGLGFMYVMENFNDERFGIVCEAQRLARVCYEESVKYAVQRKTFGKRLVDHPVIRLKLANMITRVEATYAWSELISYQMSTMSKKDQNKKIGRNNRITQSTKCFNS